MTLVFVLGKPAHRSPVIAEAIEQLRARGEAVRVVVPKAAADDDAWRVGDDVRPVRADLGDATLIAQRGLDPAVLRRLQPWADRCCNDPFATALTHRRVDLLRTLRGAGIPVPDFDVEPDYRAARSAGRVIKALDARSGRGAGVLLPGSAPAAPPFPGPYLVQEYAEGSELKAYVFGASVRTAWRGGRGGGAAPVGGSEPPGRTAGPESPHADLVRAAATAVGLELCGVDLLVTERGPVVIDVNAFPSATRIRSAADLIAAHLHVAARRCRAPW